MVTDAQINAKYQLNKSLFIIESSRIKLIELANFIKKTDYHLIQKNSWDMKKQSLFVESLIINIPSPPLIIFEIDYAKYEIIDGFQRIKAIDDFYNNCFELTGLPIYKELDRKTYKTLPSEIKKALDFRSLSFSIAINTQTYNLSQEEIQNLLFERSRSNKQENSFRKQVTL